MPPHSFGMCGSQSPHSWAALRILMMPATSWSRLCSSIASSVGFTTVVDELAHAQAQRLEVGRKAEVDRHGTPAPRVGAHSKGYLGPDGGARPRPRCRPRASRDDRRPAARARARPRGGLPRRGGRGRDPDRLARAARRRGTHGLGRRGALARAVRRVGRLASRGRPLDLRPLARGDPRGARAGRRARGGGAAHRGRGGGALRRAAAGRGRRRARDRHRRPAREPRRALRSSATATSTA